MLGVDCAATCLYTFATDCRQEVVRLLPGECVSVVGSFAGLVFGWISFPNGGLVAGKRGCFFGILRAPVGLGTWAVHTGGGLEVALGSGGNSFLGFCVFGL